MSTGTNERAPRILCAHADQNGDGAHWKNEGEPCCVEAIAPDQCDHSTSGGRCDGLRDGDGYGDAALGEWEEKGASAFHLKRRLSDEEAAVVGPVVDIRGTDEAARRVWAVRKWVVMVGMEDFAASEVGGIA